MLQHAVHTLCHCTGNIYSIYIVVILFPLIQTEAIECTFTQIDDLYYHAPLKTFASFGLSLIAVSFFIRVMFVINSDIYYRFPNLRRITTSLSVIIYLMSNLLGIIHLYYVSVGCILLFQPRSGGLCAKKVPKLYNTLYIWQIIQFFIFLMISFAKILARCCGTLLGHCLLQCLPAHIAVPIFRSLTHLTMTKCDYIFHSQCVNHWLAVTRVCPVCRQHVNPVRS